jgi:hypothetical protein
VLIGRALSIVVFAGAVLHGTAPVSSQPVASPAVECHELPRCTGCGCKGGPGYRGPNGQCVSYAQLFKVCGNPPGSPCTFENAPNTGLNRECVAGKVEKTGKAKARAIRTQGRPGAVETTE